MDPLKNKNHNLIIYLTYILIFGIAITILYILSHNNYLLFHSIIEFASIIIAIVVFVIVWSSRDIIDNNYILFIGIAFLFIGILDFFHTLSYEGMGVFPNVSANVATQLWIAARYIQGFSFLNPRIHRLFLCDSDSFNFNFLLDEFPCSVH